MEDYSEYHFELNASFAPMSGPVQLMLQIPSPTLQPETTFVHMQPTISAGKQGAIANCVP